MDAHSMHQITECKIRITLRGDLVVRSSFDPSYLWDWELWFPIVTSSISAQIVSHGSTMRKFNF